MAMARLQLLFLVVLASFCTSNSLKYSYYEDCTNKYENKNSSYTDPTILKSLNGKIKGYCSVVKVNQADDYNVKSVELFNWLGVAYAQPPVGALRFKHPRPVEPWSENVIKDGTQWPSRCIQAKATFSGYFSDFSQLQMVSVPSSEDCLYLNIAVPAQTILDLQAKNNNNNNNNRSKRLPKRLPIFVFIHGGGFIFGSSTEDIYEPSTLAATGNMIVITLNYRLGPLGFLHLQDSDASGNQGFMDQSMALKWIHDNAPYFGGDPDRITLAGESAGSFSVGYHLVYPGSWDYFRNAIMESGSLLHKGYSLVTSSEATRRAKAVLDMSGCSTTASNSTNDIKSNQDLIECARAVEPKVLFQAMSDYLFKDIANSNILTGITLLQNLPLVMDGQVFKEPFDVSLKTGRFKKCNILAGHNANEAGYSMAFSGLFGRTRQEWTAENFLNMTTFKKFIYQSFNYYPTYPQKPNAEFFKNLFATYIPLDNFHYIDSQERNYFDDMESVLTEAIFICPAVRLADIYSRAKKSVYYYSYEHRLSSTIYPVEYGVPHAEELAVVFGETLAIKKQPLLGFSTWTSTLHNYTSDERSFNMEIIRYWSNFVKHDNPNGRCSCEQEEQDEYAEHVKWEPYTAPSRSPVRHQASWSEQARDPYAYLVLKANEIRMEPDLDRAHNCLFWN